MPYMSSLTPTKAAENDSRKNIKQKPKKMLNLNGSRHKNVASCADEGKWRLARDRQEHKHWAMMWLRRIRRQIDGSQTQMLYKWCCGKIQTKIKLSLGIDLDKSCGRLSDRSIYLNEKRNIRSVFFNIQRFFGCYKRLTGSEEHFVIP